MHPVEAERWRQIHDSACPAAPERQAATRQVLVLTVFTMAAELIAGYWSESMALVADGWHMSSHAMAMGLAWVVHVACGSRRMRERMSFGTGKISALGGYTSALLLCGVAVSAGAQSIARLLWPVPISFGPAIIVAVAGLAVNVWSARILSRAGAGTPDTAPAAPTPPVAPASSQGAHSHAREEGAHHHDPSHKAAIAHVVADALTSILAIVALLGGRIFGWSFLDPATGLLGCALVVYWAVGLARTSGRTLLDFTPACGVETAVREIIAREYDAVVVDAHVWEFAPRQLACELSLIAHEPLEPEHVKTTLSSLSELVHVTVEVNTCKEVHEAEPGKPPV